MESYLLSWMQPSFWSGFLCRPLLLPPGGIISKALTVSTALELGDTILPCTGPERLEHDRLLSCPPSYQQHCWSWFEALLHSSWLTRLTLPRVSVRTGGSNCRFWPGMSPSTAGWDQAPLHWHQPGTQPSGNAGCCQGAHDHRPLTEDATRPTEKKKST